LNFVFKKILFAVFLAVISLTALNVGPVSAQETKNKTTSSKKSTTSKNLKKKSTTKKVAPKKTTTTKKVSTQKSPAIKSKKNASEELKPKSLKPENSAAKVLLAPSVSVNKSVIAKSPIQSENITRSITILKNENFARALTRSGVIAPEVAALSKVIDKSNFLRAGDLTTGQKLSLTQSLKSGSRNFTALEIPLKKNTIQIIKTGEKKYKVRRVPNSAIANKDIEKVIPSNSNIVKKTFKSGPINSSLIELAKSIGIPREVLAEAVKILSGRHNLANTIQKRDRFSVLYEEVFDKNNKPLGSRRITYISIKGLQNNIKAYRFAPDGKDSNADYYDENGNPYRSSLTNRPLRGKFKITSGFGYRTHPILKRRILHTGTDFGAKTGTPIYAAGDGIVLSAGRYGGYGNYIKIKHDTVYETAYGHLSKFAAGMKKFKKVRKGDLIGYVGSTGRSTGAHLHFELIKRGIQINSERERLPSGKKLAGKDNKDFKSKVAEVNSAVMRLTEKAKKR
jgi:murein DD-endopeptidase MepM/ murein hydrolase activator NlpD